MKLQRVKNRFCILLIFLTLNTMTQAREVLTLQTGWKFSKGNFPDAARPNFDDSQWQNVMIPHDWAIAGPTIVDGDGNTGKLPWKGEGWYRRTLDIPEAYKEKQIYLLFDGVITMPEIFVNGNLAGKWDYGYNSFYIDITSFITTGKNILAVHADTRHHDSRWYPGAGIYRKVQMIVVDPVHVAIWGTQITTPVVKPNYADVRIMTNVLNKTINEKKNIKVENIILSPKGNEVARKEATINIIAGKEKNVEMDLILNNPEKWDLKNPTLYQVKTNIYEDGQLSDTYLTTFGVRTMRFTADHGFYLNDQRVQFRGVNLHHDQGPLGAAFYTRAMERQIEIMKSMGCNAIRTSHNMPAPELLDLCDSLGILVFDEAFDKYDQKVDITDSTDFEDFAYRNIRNFVKRDRNHPCIFIWSVGNEIADVQTNTNNGFQKLQTMVGYMRKFDQTRPVTMVCDNPKSALLRHFDFYDVHSWNYQRRYSLARQLEPNKSVIISESASTVSTRGYYELPLPAKKTDFSKSLQVSSYDLSTPWWAEIPDDDFMWQQDEEYVSGEFVWTGFDYLGEPTPYTNDWCKENGLSDKDASRSSYFGIVDFCGIPKDRYYLYKSYWNQDENTIHIVPHWNWKSGNIPVFVYTNGDCAELFLNGKSLGKKCKNPASQNSTDRFRLMWTVNYEPGILKAVAYKEGIAIGENTVRTAGDPSRIRLTPDLTLLSADGMDLSYILVEALDKEGNACPFADNIIQISISGPAHVVGVGNGNPQYFDSFQGNTVKLFNGKAMIILGSEFTKGDVRISASSEGLSKDFRQLKIN